MSDRPKETVCILLAAYNGEKYIREQIESLLAQTYTYWKLFIRDDGSNDQTVSIIKEYAQKDKRISIVKDDKNNLGSCQNFAALLNFIRGRFNYIMFCDQDDYWLPFKIEETLCCMQHLEEKYKKEVPLLVYTNFTYANNDLNEIASKKGFQTTKVANLSFANLLAQNPAYGCTMMLNRALQDIKNPIPMQAENHDYWAALTASALGKISYLNKPTILYRQHNNNISTNYNSSSVVKRLRRIVLQGKNFADARKKVEMAKVFRALFANQLKERDKIILNDFISFGTGNKISMLYKNIRNGVVRQTFAQTFLFYMSVLFLKKK